MNTSNSNLGNPQFDYGDALGKSYLFYEAQRSGDLPDDNRISWRGDSTLDDGSVVGRDLEGGYFEAGNYIKFGFPMAASMTMLAWGIEEYTEAYSASGQLDEALDAIKWGTDYFLKAHVTDDNNKTLEFWGQVGNPKTEHVLWGSIEKRPFVYRDASKIDRNNPGSDLAGETAASLASAAMIFKNVDPAYSQELLENSIQLYEFAETYQSNYSWSIPQAQGTYTSSGYEDELAWGAIWLYKATGQQQYLDKAEQYIRNGLGDYTQIWDDKTYGTKVLLAEETGKEVYRNEVEEWLDMWVDGTGPVKYTPGGLAWRGDWGSLRLSANTALLAGVYSKNVNENNGRYNDFVKNQINYMLGDNPRNSSYVIGFGDNYPLRPHHRGSHDGSWETFPNNEPNAHVLVGALVGGPTEPDNDFSYNDSREDWVSNEAAIDYNAGFTGALAHLYDLYHVDGSSSGGGSGGNPPLPQATDGNDNLIGTVNGDSIQGRNGNDTIQGNQGNDTLFGGKGDDRLFAHEGNDFVNGEDGNDRIEGREQDDTLIGGSGEDTIYGGDGIDRLWAGSGNDRLYGGFGNDVIHGQGGNDYVDGQRDNDLILGKDGSDTLLGNLGNDKIYGGNGIDRLWAGSGNDSLYGGSGSDTLNGQSGDDYLNGQSGNDRIWGGNGNDTLFGGTGSDTLHGGSGSDLFRPIQSGMVTIQDFDRNLDTIGLAGSSSNYRLTSNNGDINITRIDSGRLIAVVENQSNLNLNADYFDYL